jgi:drug/metabolite transporter (DMT)-like permease
VTGPRTLQGRRGGARGSGVLLVSAVSPAPPARVAIAFAIVYVVWGSTYLAIFFAVETLPPFLMASVRFLTAGAIMYAWVRFRSGVPAPQRSHWVAAAIVGGFLLLGGNGGVVWAEQRVPSGLAALLIATVPLWMVLLEWGGGGRRPTGRVMIGIAIGFLGLGILIGPAEVLGGAATDLTGAIVLVLASLSWAAGSVASRRVRLPDSPMLGTGMEMICGGALLLVLGTLTGEWSRLDLASASPRSLWAVAYLIVFGSLIGFTAYVWLLKHVEIARVSTYAYVNPVVAVILGWALAGEELTPRVAMAAAVIVTGVAVITSGRKRPAMERPETAPSTARAIAGETIRGPGKSSKR